MPHLVRSLIVVTIFLALVRPLGLGAEEPEPVEVVFERLGSACDGRTGPRTAIVLVHGLAPRPFSGERARRAIRPGWQDGEGLLGRALRQKGDLFAFSYSQNAPIDRIARAPDAQGRTLADHVRALRADGYERVVLVGHSAGGVVARQLVEEEPAAGVTRVVQVCPPNDGSGWGRLDRCVRAPQEPFVRSLSVEADRERGRIPDDVEFVVVAGTGGGIGDLVVRLDSQWGEDLRAQGIPVVPLTTTHFSVMRSPWTAPRIAELVDAPLPRWTEDEVAAAERELLD